MADLTSQELDQNTSIVESLDGSISDPLIATAYFEDYLFKIFTDLAAINSEITAGVVTDGDNVGAGAEVFKIKDGTILDFRSLVSADASVIFVQSDDELDLSVALNTEDGTTSNSILTWNGVDTWTELAEVLMSWSGATLTMQVEDSGAVKRTVLTADADAEVTLYHDAVPHFATDADGAVVLTTGAFTLPAGTTGQEPAATNGMLRYDSTTGKLRGVEGGSWVDIVAAGNVDDGTVTSSITTWDGVDTWTELAEITIAWAVNTMTLMVNDGTSLVTGLVIDGDAEATLYYDDVANFAGVLQGLEIYDPSGGDDPALRLYHSAGGTFAANFQSFANDLFIDNAINDSDITIRASNSSPQDTTVLHYDGAARQLDLYHENTIVLGTEDQGIQVYDTSGNNPALRLYTASGGTYLAQIQSFSDDLYIDNRRAGGDIFMRTGTTGATTILHYDDTADNLELYANGVLEAETKVGGFRVDDELEIDGNLNHDGSNIGFYGTAPVAQSSAYSTVNVTTDRSLDATGDTLAQVADVLGTLIADLQATGIIG